MDGMHQVCRTNNDLLAIFTEALTNRATDHNTSQNPYFNGLEPDLTLITNGTRPGRVNVVVLIQGDTVLWASPIPRADRLLPPASNWITISSYR